MLSFVSIKSFAMLEIVAEQSIKGWDINSLPSANEVQARADKRAAEYLPKIDPTPSAETYADFCEYIKGVIVKIHDHKLRGIGKLYTTKQLAAEDPEQFQALLARMEAEDLKEMGIGE